MKALLAVVFVALLVPGLSLATKIPPPRAFYVTELDASAELEKTYDSAYCDGIARFGKRGQFPYEKYRVFDCTVKLNRRFCTDVRYKSVTQIFNWWYLVKTRNGLCY